MNRNLHARTLALSVAAVLAACGSSSKTSPPPPPLGTATIKALGGAGSAGSGGAGGAVTITGQGGGKVEVLTHGEVDASFSYAVSPPELGGNPKTVSSDATLTVDPFGRLLGDDGVSPATGLHVAASATLTLAPDSGTPDQISLNLGDGLYVEGTLVVARRASGPTGSACRLDVNAASMVIASSGTIDTHGLASRGAGGSGGGGGRVDLISRAGGVFNTGTVTTSGAAGSAGTGGAAGQVNLVAGAAAPGDVFSSGDITAIGGDGTAANGGNGGAVTFDPQYAGKARAGGVIVTSGGAGPAATGGRGGNVTIFGTAEALRVDSTISTTGGGASGGQGGAGGSVTLQHRNGGSSSLGGPVEVGGAIDASGGAGDDGGQAGSVTIGQANPQINSAGGEGVELAGFLSIQTSGGAGSVDGGDAGAVVVRQLGGTVQPGGDPRLDSVLNQADVSAAGGAGAAGIADRK